MYVINKSAWHFHYHRVTIKVLFLLSFNAENISFCAAVKVQAIFLVHQINRMKATSIFPVTFNVTLVHPLWAMLIIYATQEFITFSYSLLLVTKKKLSRLMRISTEKWFLDQINNILHWFSRFHSIELSFLLGNIECPWISCSMCHLWTNERTHTIGKRQESNEKKNPRRNCEAKIDGERKRVDR